MYAGITEKRTLELIGKGGVLYDKYKNKSKLLGLVYADIDKNDCKEIVNQFFNQIHFTSGKDLDLFWIGYRGEDSITEYDREKLCKITEININGESIPNYIDYEVFHQHNNCYLSKDMWGDYLGNSSFYIIFFDSFDGIPNRDGSVVVNFIKKSSEDNRKFCDEFVIFLRKNIYTNKGNLNTNNIEKFLDSRLRREFSDRVFEVVKGKIIDRL